MRPPVGKDKILDAALALFAEKGFHATSVDEIARKAGVSKGLTYNYFASKNELLVAIVERTSEGMVDLASGAVTPGNFQIALQRFLEQLGRMLREQRTLLSFQIGLMFDPKLKPIVDAPLKARAEKLLAATEAMFTRAGAGNPHMTARRFISELDGIALHFLSVYDNYPLDQMLVTLYQNYKDCSA